jgi:hypothetical protein
VCTVSKWSVCTSGDKSFFLTVSPKVSQQQISATATDGAGNTSELSACKASPK